MGELFSVVRRNVTAQSAAEMLGMEIRHYKTYCPWHNDRNPSLSFDRRTGKCKCFSCQRGGDAIDLTAQVLGISPLEAAKELVSAFHIVTDEVIDKRPDALKMAKLAAIRDREKEERERTGKELSALLEQERWLQKLLDIITPNSDTENERMNNLIFQIVMKKALVTDRIENLM